jgi:hydroxypyruvate reductase
MAPYFPPLGDSRRSVLVAVGKAAASMTKATFDHYGRSLPGIVLTRYGHGLSDLRTIPGLSVIEAGHPVPDDAGRRAAALVLELAQSLGQGDHLLFLVSGGGSSLLSLPAPGLSLEDKQKVTRALLACGASITELNCVRKHLSAIKGGRLALAAAPARVTTLVISDVAGDDASMVASGPTFPDSTTLQNARRILELYNIDPGAGVREALSNPNNETPSVDNPAFATAQARIVARAKGALAAAGQFLAADGYTPLYLGDDVEGDATEVGTVHAALALHHRGKRGRFALISGGELTVAVRDNAGAGGPNSEYLMSLACALNGAEGVSAIACDTDGIDGTADNAGAVIDSSTLRRARALGLDFPAQLAANRSYATFQALGDLIVTGPTRTNVNDFRVILVEGRS